MVLGKLDSYRRRKLEQSLTPYIKINSKWIKYLNIRLDTIKLLEENIGQILSDINHSNIFSDPPLRVMTIKTKINKWDLVKLKSFCTAKETLKRSSHCGAAEMSLTSNHEVIGSIPGLIQWVKDPVLLWCRSQMWLRYGIAVAVA